MSKSIHILTAAVCAFGTFSAQAATLCVDPVNPACFTTIQDAVDNTNPGDIVKISGHTYKEAVNVATGGITLAGASAAKTIIDSAGVAATPGLTIAADNVTVTGLSVNNSTDHGIFVSNDGFTLTKAAVNTPAFDCVNIGNASNVSIQASSFRFCSEDGIDADNNPPTDNLKVQGNRFFSVDDESAEVEGDNALIEKNLCEDSGDEEECFDVLGDNAVIRSNKAVNSGALAEVTGAAALIEKNTLTSGGVDDGMIEVFGDNPQVLGNRLSGMAENGIDLACNDTPLCAAARVVGNTVLNTTFDNDCILLFFNADGALVQNNSATSCSGDGFDISGNGDVTVEKNRANKGGSGNAFAAGFDLAGAGVMTVRSNTAMFFSGGGFRIEGDFGNPVGYLLQKNTAKNNGRDGFFLSVDSNTVTLLQNTASGNIQEGVDNRGDNNNFIGNILKGNRAGSDFCDSAADATGTTPLPLAANNTIGSPVATVCLD